jgi:hypothetical protein
MDDIVRKIAGLMAKANGTENEHEAAAFAAKAQEMLAKHNLTMMDVLKQSAQAAGQSVSEVTLDNKYASGWRVTLMVYTCHFYFCKCLLHTYQDQNARGRWIKRKRFLIIGKEHNAAIAISMFTYLEKTTLRLAREWMRSHAGGRAEQLDFERGCGLRLAQRLNELVEEQKAAKSAAFTGTTLPALYDSEAAAIEEFLAGRQIRSARKSKGTTIKGRGGMAGMRAAEKIGLVGMAARP